MLYVQCSLYNVQRTHLIYNTGAVDYGGCEYGECDYGECEYGGCEYGECDYGECEYGGCDYSGFYGECDYGMAAKMLMCSEPELEILQCAAQIWGLG